VTASHPDARAQQPRIDLGRVRPHPPHPASRLTLPHGRRQVSHHNGRPSRPAPHPSTLTQPGRRPAEPGTLTQPSTLIQPRAAARHGRPADLSWLSSPASSTAASRHDSGPAEVLCTVSDEAANGDPARAPGQAAITARGASAGLGGGA
jgi:hypothetical protein